MAIHKSLKSMLCESLPEYLAVADHCVNSRKDASFPGAAPGSCFGYPAAALLFAITDAIGSFHRGDGSFRVKVDGKLLSIRGDGFQHFYVLNSDYYRQTLSSSTIKALYDNFRSLLIHNAAVAPEHFILNVPGQHVPFPILHGHECVNLSPFLDLSRHAVALFLERAERVVPGSEQAKNISRKHRSTVV